MRFIIVFLSFLLFSCANDTNDKLLYTNYSNYDKNININNLPKSSPHYFSQNLLSDIDLKDAEVSEQLLFNTYMAKQLEHFEKSNGVFGCLTINGLDNEKMPISFNLKYIFENKRWLIDEIGIVFVNTLSDFSKTAQCPDEYQN